MSKQKTAYSAEFQHFQDWWKQRGTKLVIRERAKADNDVVDAEKL